MPLTPLDIRKQEFTKALRGYSTVEVDSFLEAVAEEVEEVTQQLSELKRRQADMEQEIEEYRGLERTLMQTLVSAQKNSEEQKDNSTRQAELTLKEAELRAEQIQEHARRKAQGQLDTSRKQAEEQLDTARREVADIHGQLKNLAGHREDFVTRLRHALDELWERVEVFVSTPSLDELNKEVGEGKSSAQSKKSSKRSKKSDNGEAVEPEQSGDDPLEEKEAVAMDGETA